VWGKEGRRGVAAWRAFMTVVERQYGGRGREGRSGRPAVRPGGERWASGDMLLQFLMAYSHPYALTSCSTILDGLPSTQEVDSHHLVEVEELYIMPAPDKGWAGGDMPFTILDGLQPSLRMCIWCYKS